MGRGRGDRLTAARTLASASPPVLDATLCMADTREASLAGLRKGFPALYAFSGLMALVGLGLIARGLWRP